MFGEDSPDNQDGEQPGPSRRKRQPSMSEAMPLYTLCKEDLESMDKEVSPQASPLCPGLHGLWRRGRTALQHESWVSDPPHSPGPGHLAVSGSCCDRGAPAIEWVGPGGPRTVPTLHLAEAKRSLPPPQICPWFRQHRGGGPGFLLSAQSGE